MCADTAAVTAGVVAACALADAPHGDPSLGHTTWVGATTAIAWMACLGLNRLYQARAVARPGEELRRIAVAGLIATGVVLLLSDLAGADSRRLTGGGFHVALSTGLRDFDVTRLRPQAIGEQTLVYLEPTIRGGWRSRAKRALDVVLACIGLVLSAPIIAVAAIAVRLDSSGPSLFRQVRVGRDGAEFEMIKLRSMTIDAEQRRSEIDHLNELDGPLFKVADDPRVTRVGRFLRRSSIDELPQFWNVLHGDMSVVGPRPALPSEVAGWDEQLRECLRVLPGLTFTWQVSGRSSSTFADYKRLDFYYVDNWSLHHDIRIVLKTFVAVALQHGASSGPGRDRRVGPERSRVPRANSSGTPQDQRASNR